MSGAPAWAVELYFQNLTLERLMTELQDTLNTIASEITGGIGTINDELTVAEQSIAAGATPDLTALKAAVDSVTNTASRVTAIANGQPDPANPPASSGDGTADLGQPAADGDLPPEAVAPAQPETIDTAAQTPDTSGI